jgi:hypothetical protein
LSGFARFAKMRNVKVTPQSIPVLIFAFVCLASLMPSKSAFSDLSSDPLYDALLKAVPQNIPQGFSGPAVSGIVQEAEKSAGVAGFVQITFANDPKARVNYVFFPSAEQARPIHDVHRSAGHSFQRRTKNF